MRALAVGGVAALMLVWGSPTWAHGDLQGSDPKEGARVKSVPEQVSLTLTEAPGPGSTMKVADGCDRDVVLAVSRSGPDLKATVDGGRPGHWMVRYRAISSVDGHLSKGMVHFMVAGKKDCSPDKTPSPDTSIDGGVETRVANPDPPGEGGGFPVVGLAIGTIVLVGIALLLRRTT